MAIAKTCITFLNWYKQNHDKLQVNPMVRGFNPDSVKKDSIVRIDFEAVEAYLKNFKNSGYVSDDFLSRIKEKYQSVSDTLMAHPLKDYFGPVPGLESDVIFGFGLEDIFVKIKNAKTTKYLRVANQALISIQLSYTIELVFTLTRSNKHWLIDFVGYNRDNKYSVGYQ